MAGKRRKFGAEFREEAVRTVAETGKPIAQVAQDLGINETALASWVSRARRAGGPASAEPTSYGWPSGAEPAAVRLPGPGARITPGSGLVLGGSSRLSGV